MTVKVTYENMTVRNIIRNKDRLRFDLAIQRNLVWTEDQKSLFIHSLLYGFPFPPCYAQDTGDNYLWILDGKQRLSCVIDFTSNLFALSPNTPEIEDGLDVTNHTFNALPQHLQERILDDVQFTVFLIRNMTEEERDILFERLNSGTSLSRQEISRVRGGLEVLEFLDRLKNIPFISEKVNITSKQKNRYVDEELVLHILSLYLNKDNVAGFDKKSLENFIIELRDKPLTEDKENSFITVANYLEKVFTDGATTEEYKETERNRKRILKKVHVPMIFMMGMEAYKLDIAHEEFYNWIKDFLVDNYDKNSVYAEAARSGSAKKENIKRRLTEMEKSFNDHFKVKQLV